jgi:KipI family sensor histidine kinase inhibitor
MRAADAGAGRDLSIEPLGETMLLLRLGLCVDEAVNAHVHRLAQRLRFAGLPGVVDIVPAYAALALHYAPAAWSDGDRAAWRNLADAVRKAIADPAHDAERITASLEIPVRYGGARGMDLQQLARDRGMDEVDVIARHTGADYRVAMLGFAPGFAYLLGLDPALHAPRRAAPRLRVPAGSVAIGGAQTGIYPSELPGGWQLIGQTPLRLFDAARDPPCLFVPGDRVRFRAVDDEEFALIAARDAA